MKTQSNNIYLHKTEKEGTTFFSITEILQISKNKLDATQNGKGYEQGGNRIKTING